MSQQLSSSNTDDGIKITPGRQTDHGSIVDSVQVPKQVYRPLPTAATALPIGAFATTLTGLSFSLMEWRGVTISNIHVGNFFFVAAFGLLISAQWELAAGNGFAYAVFSAFALFYAGYGAILTPAFGITAAYGDDHVQLNNALGLFVMIWTIFVVAFLIASLPTNLVYIFIFIWVFLAFLFIAASYFAVADGNAVASVGLKKAGGVFSFLAGLTGWYLTIHLLIKDSIVELPLGDTSGYFPILVWSGTKIVSIVTVAW